MVRSSVDHAVVAENAVEELLIAKEYATGVGHIEQRGAVFLVSFHGRRVRQAWAPSLEAARFALRRLAGAR